MSWGHLNNGKLSREKYLINLVRYSLVGETETEVS